MFSGEYIFKHIYLINFKKPVCQEKKAQVIKLVISPVKTRKQVFVAFIFMLKSTNQTAFYWYVSLPHSSNPRICFKKGIDQFSVQGNLKS